MNIISSKSINGYYAGKLPWFNLWFLEGIMKPEMRSEKTSGPPEISSIRRLIKVLKPKYKFTIAEEAFLQSRKEADFFAEIIQKSSQPVLIVKSVINL